MVNLIRTSSLRRVASFLGANTKKPKRMSCRDFQNCGNTVLIGADLKKTGINDQSIKTKNKIINNVRSEQKNDVLNFLKSFNILCLNIQKSKTKINSIESYESHFHKLNFFDLAALKIYKPALKKFEEESKKMKREFDDKFNKTEVFTNYEIQLLNQLLTKLESQDLIIIIEFFIKLKNAIETDEKFDIDEFAKRYNALEKKDPAQNLPLLRNEFFKIISEFHRNNKNKIIINRKNNPFTFYVILKCINNIIDKNNEKAKKVEKAKRLSKLYTQSISSFSEVTEL